MNIIRKLSPNYSTNRHGYKPEAIIIHIMDGSLAGTDVWFAHQASKVSAHYGVGKKGEVHQYVDEKHVAQHAGIVEDPSWPLIRKGTNPNWYTIGIEHEGWGGEALTDAQLRASAELIAGISKRWSIPLDTFHVIPHHSIRVSKPCPGAEVDISRLISLAKSFSQSVS